MIAGGLFWMIRSIEREFRGIAYPICGKGMFIRKAGELGRFFKPVNGRRAPSRY